MTILIIGSGIAGLTAALSLHQVGADCRVFESVPDVQPLGAGINLLPHAVRELTEPGLRDALASASQAILDARVLRARSTVPVPARTL
jgi:2-polyprenyl-6-methoxyphenol hydroxylase-like FAD-dependent oxidoreductase